MKMNELWKLGVCLGALVMMGQAEEPAELKFEKTPSWDLTCEVFSLPLSEAAKLKRAGKTDREDYAELVKRVEAGKVGQEEFLMMRVIAGGLVTLEEIKEMIYATEYDPPEMPNQIGDLAENIEAARNLISPANPTAFETKNVGTTLKVELVPSEKEKVDLGVTLTLVDFLGRQTWGQWVAEAEMPRFTEQNLKSQLKVRLDSPTLLGSLSPPAALQAKEGEREVWLAFVTVSSSKE